MQVSGNIYFCRMKKWPKTVTVILPVLAMTSAALFAKYLERSDASLAKEVSIREWQEACPPAGLLENGDLIFRHSRGTISNMLLHFSQKDSRYSHAGIVYVEKGRVYV